MNLSLSEKIFKISSSSEFEALALEIFWFQAKMNPVYASFIDNLKIIPEKITSTRQIPFLPVSFFKNHVLLCGSPTGKEVVFSSSGTTGVVQSQHLVKDISLYEQSFKKGFDLFYEDVRQYTILALLPSYLQRAGSSLIYMTESLIQHGKPGSGFFLYNHDELFRTIEKLKRNRQKVILIGVTYALLDFTEKFKIDFPELIVMETGGMKGKRKELIREELHDLLKKGFGVNNIHSEYGMTEMLSQAYSKGEGIFSCPPWLKVLARDTNDPLSLIDYNQTGGLNIIDLANLHSCSFIATQDLGKVYDNGQFEVLGRFDNSDIRGCNLLVQ